MCVPPLTCVIQRSCPAYKYRARIEDAFRGFAHRLGERFPLPCHFAKQLRETLHSQDFGGQLFELTALVTVVEKCSENRQLPSADIGADQVLFDVTVKLGGDFFHLTCLTRCRVLRPGKDVVAFFPGSLLTYR